MAYASQSLGSTPFGGLSGGAGNPTPDTLTMTMVVNAPSVRIYSTPAFLAGVLTLNAPTPVVTPNAIPTLTLNLVVLGSTFQYSQVPPTQQLALTLNAPLILSVGELSVQVLTAAQPPPIPVVDKQVTTVQATLTAEAAIPTPTATPAEVSGSVTTNAPTVGTSPGGLVQSLTGTINTPVPRIYSLPATFAASISVLTPTVQVSPTHVTLDLNLTIGNPSPTLEKPVADQALAIDTMAPIPTVYYPGSTLNALLSVNQPTPVVRRSAYLPPLQMGYPIPNTNLAVTIVRYIKDPLVTGGCPQCGTFMYDGGRSVRGSTVKRGRNFDLDKGRREDRYVRCGRCGFILHKDRHVHQTDGSRTGWGMKYSEIEAGS